MKKLGATLVLMSCLVMPSMAQTIRIGGPRVRRVGRRAPERHPALRNAIKSLQRAKSDLQAASHDFGGHRVEALAACDNAIVQLNKALAYDRR